MNKPAKHIWCPAFFKWKMTVFKGTQWFQSFRNFRNFHLLKNAPCLILHRNCCSSQRVSFKYLAISTPLANTHVSVFHFWFLITRAAEHTFISTYYRGCKIEVTPVIFNNLLFTCKCWSNIPGLQFVRQSCVSYLQDSSLYIVNATLYMYWSCNKCINEEKLIA